MIAATRRNPRSRKWLGGRSQTPAGAADLASVKKIRRIIEHPGSLKIWLESGRCMVSVDMAAVALARCLRHVQSATAPQGLENRPGRVAGDLSVRHLLDGSVRICERNIRITTRLIDAKAHRQTRAERYDREPVRISDLLSEIASRVVAVPELHFSSVGKPARGAPRRSGRMNFPAAPRPVASDNTSEH